MDWSPSPGTRKQVKVDGSKAFAFEIEAELRQGSRRSSVTNPRLQDVWFDYVDFLKLHRSPATVKEAFSSWNKLSPIFAKKPVNFISRNDIEDFKRSTAKTPRMCNRCLTRLTAFINWMVEQGFAEPLPFKVKHLPYTRPLPKVPTEREFVRFMSYFKGLKRAAILMMGESGMRVTECLNLRWEDLNLESHTVLLRHKTKRNKHRIAIISDEVIELLSPHKKKYGYIFTSKRTGKPYTSLLKIMQTACEKAGLETNAITHHTLRHYFATNLLNAEGDLRLVQASLGHASSRTTEIYTHVAANRLKSAISKLSHMNSKKKGL